MACRLEGPGIDVREKQPRGTRPKGVFLGAWGVGMTHLIQCVGELVGEGMKTEHAWAEVLGEDWLEQGA